MSEWKEYSGSDEQINELSSSKDGIALMYDDSKKSTTVYSLEDITTKDGFISLSDTVTHYLICNPHPLADMICQQARTGQPVYVKLSDIPNSMYTHFINTFSLVLARPCYSVYVTNKPDWNIPNAEYSFTSFDE